MTSIKEVLEALSHPSKRTHCPVCGSLLQQRRATLSLDGTEETWEIFLPTCRQCHADKPKFVT